jgi:hypothetical protein
LGKYRYHNRTRDNQRNRTMLQFTGRIRFRMYIADLLEF